MSLLRLLGLLILFLFFEALAAVIGRILAPNASVFVVCGAATAAVIAIWIVYVLTTAYLTRPRFPQPVRSAAPPAGPQPGPARDPSLDDFEALVREANQRLATAPVAPGKIRPTVFDLPFYLVVGPERSGKTSAVTNSGLEPQLLAGEAVREGAIVPTALCNLWFANDAIFADVSGKLFADDNGRWNRFINKLRGTQEESRFRRLWAGWRRRVNLRGAIVCIDSTPFSARSDPERLNALSHQIRDRLETVGAILGVSFPAYMLFTKCDGLTSFPLFFGRFGKDEDQQIVGATLPQERHDRAAEQVYAQAENKRLTSYFNELCAGLADKRPAALAREQTARNKPAIYEFPREFRRMRSDVVKFLVDAFRPNPLQPGAILRGFYFSGTRQIARAEGFEDTARHFAATAPVDATRIFRPQISDATRMFQAGPMTGTAALARRESSTVPRWCFLAELFSKVILADESARRDMLTDRRLDLQRRLAFGGALAAACLAALAWTISGFQNHSLISEVQPVASAVARIQVDARRNPPLEAVRNMDALREKIVELSNGEPLRFHWGLYSGGRLLNTARDLYFRQFRSMFLDLITGSLEARLATPQAADVYGPTYDRLSSYLAITRPGCKPEVPVLAQTLPVAWIANRELDPGVDALGRKQIEFYISELERGDPYGHSVSDNPEVVRTARNFLKDLKPEEAAYASLIQRVDAEIGRSALQRTASLSGNYGALLKFSTDVGGSFSVDGWDKVQQHLKNLDFTRASDSCVLGGNAVGGFVADAALVRQLRTRYIRDYIERWKGFLAGAGVKPYANVADAAQKLQMLADNRSPLLALIAVTADSTYFAPRKKDLIDNAEAKGAGVLKGIIQGATGQQAAKNAESMLAAGDPADIGKVFQPAQAVEPHGDRTTLKADAGAQQYAAALFDLSQKIAPLAETSARSDTQLNQSAKAALENAEKVVQSLTAKFSTVNTEGVDQTVARLLNEPLRLVREGRLIEMDPRKGAKDKINAAWMGVCRGLDSLRGKFPFNPNSDRDVTPAELARVFGPAGGELAKFSEAIGNFAIQQGNVWRPAPNAEIRVAALPLYSRLMAIQQAFFPDPADQPRLLLDVSIFSDSAIDSATLEAGGKVVSTHGRALQIVWPAGEGDAALTIMRNGPVPFGRRGGYWALFRLLRDADHTDGSTVFDFSTIQKGFGKPEPVPDKNNRPTSVQVRVGAHGVDVFSRSFFQVGRCRGPAAQ